MPHLDRLKSCELHVHTGGCLYLEDLLELARDTYQRIDWRLYVDTFAKTFGTRPDPETLFRDALTGDPEAVFRLRRHYVVDPTDAGDFARFQAKLNLAICLYRYWWLILGREADIEHRILARHRAEGLRYVEYRAMAPYDADNPEGFIAFHALVARAIQEGSGRGFEARYIISLPRWDSVETYHLVQVLFDQHSELIPTIVGLDFCFFEEGYPPETARPLFERLRQDNQQRPERALEVVYHVGETYFDKSLESAVRWCHQAAELGARRLGHAVALGLDPQVAAARRPDAHLAEPASERLAQIAYDLHFRAELESLGIQVDAAALEKERHDLARRPAATPVERPYPPQRLEEIRRRQDFVLNNLAEMGTIIETCPTSNLRIAAVPDAGQHPIHRFLSSPVDLVVGADDPGIFDSPLAAEVDWVAAHAGLSPVELADRLGDPRRFRLSAERS